MKSSQISWFAQVELMKFLERVLESSQDLLKGALEADEAVKKGVERAQRGLLSIHESSSQFMSGRC